MGEIVDLECQAGSRSIEGPPELTGQAVQPIPDDGAVHVELPPAHVGGDAVPHAVQTRAPGVVEVFGVGGADDAEAPVEERRHARRQLAAIEQVEAQGPVGIEALVLGEEPDLGKENVVDHGVEVGPRRAGRVVHHLIGDELRLARVAILEQAEELRRERVGHDG